MREGWRRAKRTYQYRVHTVQSRRGGSAVINHRLLFLGSTAYHLLLDSQTALTT